MACDMIYAYVGNVSFTLNVMQVTAVVTPPVWAGPSPAGVRQLIRPGLGPATYAGWQKGLGGTKVIQRNRSVDTLASAAVNAESPYEVTGRRMLPCSSASPPTGP
jgi:hypothetical protein